MIERVIEASVRNRFLVLLAAAGLTVFGVYAMLDTPVDAIPDLGEKQVIVFTDWPGRSPQEVEDQVTYPLSRKLQGLSGVKAVRSSSEFNYSMITVVFEEATDYYFARQRVSERLAQVGTVVPPGVTPYLGPDATALGQVFWYTVEPDQANPIEPARLWALNKFYVAPQLSSAPGVSEVAVVGGTPLEYQVDVRPEDLRAYGLTAGEVYAAVARSNQPAAGGVVQKGNAEYIVRGVGWIRDKTDIENAVIKEVNGTPVFVKTVARVTLGPQYRRGVFETNGSEVTGGVVLMRNGENPLRVTEGVKEKIRGLQPGLPRGVQIVPAYDRTRLVRGAIDSLGNVMWHEMVIAAVAVLLVLAHVRSAFVVCLTLPLSVLFSFGSMWILRRSGVVDVQADIMSLAGITISVGVLVDQAIVMVENATHHLKQRFGNRPVTGDTRDVVLPALTTVGRPIFFSVLIMLLSFVPVFLLTGREGKLFYPLAVTKSLALIGTAVLSVTVVPALIPGFVRGHLKSEADNWIVRGLTRVYRPMLTGVLQRINLVMWAFAALLIAGAGMFPLQAVAGQGADTDAWKVAFLAAFSLVVALTVWFTRGLVWQFVSLATLTAVGLWAYHLPKIGVSFMPMLDEGTTLDMPVTVPRASVTQVADDLKARDALIRGFPEVESVIGKAGRAETATDPAPLDMVETIVNFRPRSVWPRRVLKYPEAEAQVKATLAALEAGGFVTPAASFEDSKSVVNEVTQKALERFDEVMRELASRRYAEFEASLESELVRFAAAETVGRVQNGGHVGGLTPGAELDLAGTEDAVKGDHYRLARGPTEDAIHRLQAVLADRWATAGYIPDSTATFHPPGNSLARVEARIRQAITGRSDTLSASVLRAVEDERERRWAIQTRVVDHELFDRGTQTFTWLALEELTISARSRGVLQSAARGTETDRFASAVFAAQLGQSPEAHRPAPFAQLHAEVTDRFRARALLWKRSGGPKGDLVDDEFGRVLQVPGWSNIFTQPIINRVEMLSTGVRTDVGVKVFGPDMDTVCRVCSQIEAVLKSVPGGRDVVAAPVSGKGYLEVAVDRTKAARFGVSVDDIQSQIETAVGGKAATYTVEARDRFPVRVRYARAAREDEEAVRRLLIPVGDADKGRNGSPRTLSPDHSPTGRRLIPLSAVADARIREGPAVIKSENGRLVNYVTLNVRGRDAVGFVDGADRVVARKVQLPVGVHIEWTGEYEHHARAARTLRWVFPITFMIILCVLYLTYRDWADAGLMMMTVPEALAGGAFFLVLFPKLLNGWDATPVDFSVAVWVGFIACFGMATETGIIMLVYLREAIERRGGLEHIRSLEELEQAVIEGAVHRLRPKLLTEGVAIVAIFPMAVTSGVGCEVLSPMALPVLGGLLISDEVVDLFLPVRFYWVRRARWLKLQAEGKLAHQQFHRLSTHSANDGGAPSRAVSEDIQRGQLSAGAGAPVAVTNSRASEARPEHC